MATPEISQTLQVLWEAPSIQTLLQAFAEKNIPLRIVGGAIRNALLGAPVKDIDLTTPLPPEEMLDLLSNAQIKAIPTGIAHGTVTAILDGKPYEITTLRQDVDCDGRHAEIRFTNSWEEDAARRDFTINAMSCIPNGTLYDYHGGLDDLKARHLRFIGNPTQRIEEDYLRILRYFRFLACYNLEIHPNDTGLIACANQAPHLADLSGERIQNEMIRLLEGPYAPHILSLMQEHKILKAIGITSATKQYIPHLRELESTCTITPCWIRTLCALCLDSFTTQLLIKCWKLSKQDGERLRTCQQWQSIFLTTPLEQKKCIRKVGPDNALTIGLLHAIKEQEAPDDIKEMITIIGEWSPPSFPLSGRELMQAFSLPPGKHIGLLLKKGESWWEDNEYEPDQPAILKYIQDTCADLIREIKN